MQFQADLLRVPILVSEIVESTAWGAAKLAARAAGFWTSVDAIDHGRRYDRFKPRMERRQAELLRKSWKEAVRRLLS
jgi:glycerol kinase